MSTQILGRDIMGSARRNRRHAAAAAFGTAAWLAAGTARGQGLADRDELRVIDFSIFYGLDPVHEFSPGALRSVGAAEGLLRLTPALEVETDLAQSYELVDPFTWLVGLRPGVAFWSGRPVDAPAVVKSLERARQLAPGAAAQLRGVRVDVADERTVRFAADEPIPGLPLNLANPALVIHNADSYGPLANPFDVGATDLTGPFRLTALEPRTWATLERHDGYWGPRPRTARLRIQEVSDPDARTLAALSGEADIVRNVPPEGAGAVERARALRLIGVPFVATASAYLNTRRPPFDDVRVRQALAWAVDREELLAQVQNGRGEALPSWLASNPLYPEAKKVGYTRVDLARAGQLLDESGWRLPAGGRTRTKDGQPLRFRLLWSLAYRPTAEVLQAHWARLGAEVQVEGGTDYGIIESRRAQDDWDVLLDLWGTTGEPAAVLRRHVDPEGDLNFSKFRDAGLDALLAEFSGLLDLEARRQQALKVNSRYAEVVPFIPLYARQRLFAVSRTVRNYVPHPSSDYEVHPDLWAAV